MTRANPLSGPAHPDEYIKVFLTEYYGLLNQDSDFISELSLLFDRFKSNEFPRRGPLNELEKVIQFDLKKIGKEIPNNPTPESMDADFSKLGNKWKLPKRAYQWDNSRNVPDLYFSFRRWKLSNNSNPNLNLSPWIIENIDTAIVIEAEDCVFEIDLLEPEEIINSITNKKFHTKSEAKKLLREKVRELKSKGWKEFRTHSRDKERRKQLLRRLYLRTVKDLTWKELSEREMIEERALIAQMKKISIILGIPIKRPRGRPKKS